MNWQSAQVGPSKLGVCEIWLGNPNPFQRFIPTAASKKYPVLVPKQKAWRSPTLSLFLLERGPIKCKRHCFCLKFSNLSGPQTKKLQGGPRHQLYKWGSYDPYKLDCNPSYPFIRPFIGVITPFVYIYICIA